MSPHKRRRDLLMRRLKKRTREVRHRATVPAIRAAVWMLSRLPHGLALAIGRGLGRIGFLLGGAARRRTIDQLLQAEVAKTADEARRIARRVFEQTGMYAMELPVAMYWSGERSRESISYEGFDYLDDYDRGGKGLVGVVCHMSSWELLSRAYYLYLGRRTYTAMAPASNPALTQWLQDMRRRFGCEPFFDGGRGIAFFKELKRGHDIALLADQDSKKYQGVFVDFFGRPARTPSGPAMLARKVGTPIVPSAIRRNPDDPRRLIAMAGRPIAPDPALDEKEDILRMTQAYTKVFEDWIRQSPQDWVWMHERWRRRPK